MDIKKPPEGQQQLSQQAIKSDLVPEVVAPIPVKQPGSAAGTPSETNPITSQQQAVTSDDDMDKVLDDVSAKVKSSDLEKQTKTSWFKRVFKKPAKMQKKSQQGTKTQKPILITAVAVVIGLGLASAAYLAFQSEVNVGPRATESSRKAGINSSVTAKDIEQLQAELKAIETLDGSQDFDPEALNETSLGL